MSRIDSNRGAYESWPVDVQEAVHAGRAIPGMTPDQVEMALGKPTQVESRSGKDGDEEIWVYKKSASRLPGILDNTSVGVGTGIGPVSVGTSVPITGGRRSRTPSDAEDQEIVFKNGAVVRGSS
ncbi:MAG TPA: hypothetical protein VHD62_09140 [Opitutaceae bacterium]|nr:hypothetical protein [Opitutaceae bacterium]